MTTLPVHNSEMIFYVKWLFVSDYYIFILIPADRKEVFQSFPIMSPPITDQFMYNKCTGS